MRIVDANVLLQAVNKQAPDHARAERWLDAALSGASPVGSTWIVLVAFIRLSTRPGVFAAPLTIEHALDVVDGWLGQPSAHVLQPTARHAKTIGDLL